MIRQVILLILFGGLVGTAPSRAGAVDTRFLWADGKPKLQSTISADGQVPAELQMPVRVYDAKNALAMETVATFAVTGPKPWRVEVLLDKITEFKQQYRVELALQEDSLGLDYRETLYFAKPDDALWSYGLRRQGAFPEHKVHVTAAVRDFKGTEFRDLPVTIGLFDADENSVQDVVKPVMPGARPTWHAIEITPPAGKKLRGPCRVDVSIESDVYSLFLNTSFKFPYPNAAAPVTGFESGDDSLWFTAAAEPPRPEHTLQMYYTPQLQDFQPRPYPGLVFDSAEKHSGRQSLRVDYKSGDRVHVFSRQYLPGKPSMLSVWVKGNETQDQLWITYEDFINYTLPAWQRNANFERARICTLDFAGWRRFRVPVLGDGMQQTGLKGSSPAIDSPVLITAITVEPGQKLRLKKGATDARETISLWLDDVTVETQAPAAELLSLELQGSNTDGELTPDGKLYVAVANGFAGELKGGRLTLSARNGKGEPVFTATQELRVLAGQTATAEFALAELAAKKPRGPVDLEVLFTDAATAGARLTQHMVLKSADQGGLCFDFEKPDTYTGLGIFQRHPHEAVQLRCYPPLATITAGGAEGSAHALNLPVNPGAPPDSPTGVLLHPALPGQLDRIEIYVKGDGKPVILQPWLMDGSNTGIWLRNYNTFWPAPITVDWSDWRKVTIKAPPIPAHYGDRNFFFYRKPWYPVNLAFNARRAGDAKEPAQLWLDSVRVLTHLPENEELQVDIDFPDETQMHAAGTPLALAVVNFGSAPRALKLPWCLRNYQGFDAARDTLEVTVPPGSRQKLSVMPALPPGIYDLTVEGLGSAPLVKPVLAADTAALFGPEPLATLRDPVKLRQILGLMTEKAYLDWDNTEPMPNTFHFGWFAKDLETRGANGTYRMVPVVGFSADWAGPEAVDAIQKETYTRYIPNLYQVPARLIDWSRFVRECVREFRTRFDEWAFWENPDIDAAPQFIPPAKYPEMLATFQRWVKMYNPAARVTANGFNFNRVLGYLDQIKDPASLAFDDISVQMNIGELSPEGVDLEGFLDELDMLLRLRETGRRVQTAELDWGIGQFLTPLQQAAYHVRAAMILNSRRALPHQFSLANGGFEFEGYGTFYRLPYGSTNGMQTLKPVYIPKPSFFAHVAIQKFLKEWQFVARVLPADRSLDNNRIFLYRNAAGQFTAAVWRVAAGERVYRLPPTWAGATAVDAFGFPAKLEAGLRLNALPLLVRFPAGAALPQLVHDCRHLEAADGSFPMVCEFRTSDADAAVRFAYKAAGSLKTEEHTGVIPAAYKARDTFVTGLTSETFVFTNRAAGSLLLKRRWWHDGSGQKLSVTFNDQPAAIWDLGLGQGNDPGIREATFVLRQANAGENRLTVAYEKPGNSALYRIEPLAHDYVELTRWGALNTRQTQGDVQGFKSAVGTPLRIGKQDYDDGLGAHAVSFIEYPLDAQFKSFTVTVGIDAQTEGRGSVVFRVFVDGQEKATSGTLNGFSASKTLKIDGLENAKRLVLSVMDAGDGNKSDLGNWVDGKLYLK